MAVGMRNSPSANAGIVDSALYRWPWQGGLSLTFDAQVPLENFLAARVMLEGPYNTSTGLMEDALRWDQSFPLSEPYTALGYTHVGGGEETVDPLVLSNTGDKAIVDWVGARITQCGCSRNGGSYP